MATDIKSIVTRAETLFTSEERQNTDSVWSDLSEFMLNNQYGAFKGQGVTGVPTNNAISTAPGSRRTRRIFDSTALQAVQDLASAFQGTLTNPATVWSKLRFQQDDLNNDEESVAWLEETNRIMHNKFNESNFDTESSKAYQSLVSLANMALFFEQDGEDFRFTSLHMGQIVIAEDKNSVVDTVYRKFSLTAKQAFEKWGANLHSNILKVLEKTPDQQFQFLHAVLPREPNKVKLNELGLAPGESRPVASIYIDMTHHNLLEESGYYEMPIFVPRWSLMPGEVYGRGPGHYALPDTRTLNRLKQRGLEAIDLQVRPPMLANRTDVFGQLDLRPGGISIVKNVDGIREFVSQARSDILQFSVEELRNSIRSIFFLDKLLLPPRTETGEMTAFEVSQRIEQMQRVLGPVLSRLNHEFLNPLVIRAFKIMLRSGVLPELPDLLKERGIDVEIVFVNQLARAQQIQDVSTIQQWIQNMAQLAQLAPEVLDNINTDGIAKHTAKILGVPEVAVQNDKVVEEIRESRAQQQQQAQAMETATQAADIASKTQ